MKSHSIAIIGAGMAGMACAHRLQGAGWSVKLFDKGRKPGGRIATRHAEGCAFDFGSQYFRVRTKPFIELTDQWMAAGILTHWLPRAIHIASDGTRTNVDNDGWCVGTPEMRAIGLKMAEGLDIALACRIAQLQRTNEGWYLQPEQGEIEGPFTHLAVTCPAPQTAELLGGFTPLAAKAEAATMLPCFAVMAHFDAPVKVKADAIKLEDEPLAWAVRNNSKPGRSEQEAWVLHASHDWSRRHLEMPKEEVATTLLAAFGEALGQPLEASWLCAHRWLYAKPVEPCTDMCYYDANVRVGMAGDWCHIANVEGAYLSGRALAELLLR